MSGLSIKRGRIRWKNEFRRQKIVVLIALLRTLVTFLVYVLTLRDGIYQVLLWYLVNTSILINVYQYLVSGTGQKYRSYLRTARIPV